MRAIGFHVEPGHTGAEKCKVQWKNLVDSYKEYIDNAGSKATGKASIKQPEFYEELSTLLGILL